MDHTRAMPRYQCHKIVQALEIASTDRLTCKVFFKDEAFSPITVPADMWTRYRPVPGDFYVVYRNDYQSFSPRQEFLDGYTRIDADDSATRRTDGAMGQSFAQIREGLKQAPGSVTKGGNPIG